MVLVVAVAGHVPTAAVLDVGRVIVNEKVPDVFPLSVLVPAPLNLVGCSGRPPYKVRGETGLEEGLLWLVGLQAGEEERQENDRDTDRDRHLTELRVQITGQSSALIRFTFNILH